jgi:hypothetical protein
LTSCLGVPATVIFLMENSTVTTEINFTIGGVQLGLMVPHAPSQKKRVAEHSLPGRFLVGRAANPTLPRCPPRRAPHVGRRQVLASEFSAKKKKIIKQQASFLMPLPCVELRTLQGIIDRPRLFFSSPLFRN